MDWKKWWRSERDIADDHSGGPLPGENGDWVVLPYRIVEPCRLSLYTIASHPDLPEHVRLWIIHWLGGYNQALSAYFSENYGPDVFPVLRQISDSVKQVTENYYTEQGEAERRAAFDRWEEELRNGRDQSPPDSPPAS